MLNSERIVPENLNEPFYVEHIQRYRFALPHCRGKFVLDLGCGVGYGSYFLARNRSKHIDALDIDPKAIKYAQKRYTHTKIKYWVSDAKELPFDKNVFDCVVSFEVIEHIKEYTIYLKEIKRVLKKNGKFILSTPNILGHRHSTSAYHHKEFSPKELLNTLKRSGFKVKLYGQFFEDDNYVKSESNYFKRYNVLTLNGNNLIKKLLHLIPSQIKTTIYKLIWAPFPDSPSNSIVIKKSNLERATTLIAVCSPR